MRRSQRVRSHTADVIMEASGPDLAACCEEAVAALVELYADTTAAEAQGEHVVAIAAGPPERMLLTLLEEVIFVLDTSDAVPVSVHIHARPGGLDAVLALSSRSSVQPTGAVPKAVSRSELSARAEPSGVRCSFLVDV